MAKPKKPDPKPTPSPKLATVKPKKKAAASVKTVTAKPTTTNLVVTTSTSSPFEDVSGLDNLPLEACMELTRRLLISISSLPDGEARPRGVLKTVILFVAEYSSAP
jgi:hypothetical protein